MVSHWLLGLLGVEGWQTEGRGGIWPANVCISPASKCHLPLTFLQYSVTIFGVFPWNSCQLEQELFTSLAATTNPQRQPTPFTFQLSHLITMISNYLLDVEISCTLGKAGGIKFF